jgi:hypothetical protein
MNKAEIELVTKMIESALRNDNGVTEETFDLIHDLAGLIKDENLTEMLRQVNGTDGNFYLPDDY